MNAFKKVTVNIPAHLFELGLTETQIQGLVNRWLVVSLFQQNKITASEAGALLSTDRDGFLAMLDEQGILYENVRENRSEAPRVAAPLAELAQTIRI